MMKRLWAEALELVRQGGAKHVLLKYQTGGDIDRQVAIDVGRLSDDTLEKGVEVDDGDVLFPIPTTAVLSAYPADKPVIIFSCDVRREEKPSADNSDSLQPLISTPPPFSDTLNDLMALFPERDVLNLPDENVSPVPVLMPTMTQSTSVDVSPSTGEHRGTSCHQCKNARSLEHLAYCSKLFSKRTSQDMRHCRKKFCQGCLSKFYGDSIENSRVSGWQCPSCRGSCRCAACERKRRKGTAFAEDSSSIHPSAAGGLPSMPDEQVEEEGFVEKAGKGRRVVNRSHPYSKEMLNLDLDTLVPRGC